MESGGGGEKGELGEVGRYDSIISDSIITIGKGTQNVAYLQTKFLN